MKKYDDLHVIVLRSYISVSYTDKYDRNTITGITAKHGRKRPFFPVYGRIRPFTEFVTFDLGPNKRRIEESIVYGGSFLLIHILVRETIAHIRLYTSHTYLVVQLQ